MESEHCQRQRNCALALWLGWCLPQLASRHQSHLESTPDCRVCRRGCRANTCRCCWPLLESSGRVAQAWGRPQHKKLCKTTGCISPTRRQQRLWQR